MPTSATTFKVPVVPEPTFEDADHYYWSTSVKDSLTQLSTVVSSLDEENAGTYGMIYTQNGSTPQTGIGGTPELLTGFATDGLASGTTPSAADDKITVSKAGVYLVLAQISFSGTVTTEFNLHIHKTGTTTNFGTHRVLGTGGDVGSCSTMGIVSLAAGDDVSIYVNSDGSSDSITVVDGQLILFRIA